MDLALDKVENQVGHIRAHALQGLIIAARRT